MTEKLSYGWTAVILFATSALPCSHLRAVTVLGDPIPLATLTANTSTSIVVGDLQLNNFVYASNGDMPPAAAIDVIPISDDGGNFGIRLQGAFMDSTSSGTSDALVRYGVSVLNLNKAISAAHLAGVPLASGSGSFANADLSFSSNQTISVSAVGSPPHSVTSDSVDIAPPLPSLTATTDLLAIAGSSGTASIAYLDQTFSELLLHAPVPGDFNTDGQVDAADYVSWRHGLGTTRTQSEYDVWRTHFDQTAAGAALGDAANSNSRTLILTSVPEPTFAIYLLTPLAFGIVRRRNVCRQKRSEQED